MFLRRVLGTNPCWGEGSRIGHREMWGCHPGPMPAWANPTGNSGNEMTHQSCSALGWLGPAFTQSPWSITEGSSWPWRSQLSEAEASPKGMGERNLSAKGTFSSCSSNSLQRDMGGSSRCSLRSWYMCLEPHRQLIAKSHSLALSGSRPLYSMAVVSLPVTMRELHPLQLEAAGSPKLKPVDTGKPTQSEETVLSRSSCLLGSESCS